MENPKYNFYATLLDSFDGYIHSDKTYQAYWGFAENPSITEEEFHLEQRKNLIDKINRVPFETTEAIEKGNAFEEVINSIIKKQNSEKMTLKSYPATNEIWVQNKEYLFKFKMDLCIEIANYLSGAICQVYTEAIIETKYGNVKLFGFIDYLLPFFGADLKTISSKKGYSAFKFKSNWQNLVYPYCLNKNGIFINQFEYVATDFENTFSEEYYYNPEIDDRKLVNQCELIIDFLEENREQITDKKIFNL